MQKITVTKTEKYAVSRMLPLTVKIHFLQFMGCARKVYNLYVDYLYKQLVSCGYKPGDTLPSLTLPNVTTFKAEYPYLKAADSLALCNAKIDFENAMKKYNEEFDHKSYTKRALRRAESGTEPLSFRGLKGMPKFHAKAKGYFSYTTNNQQGTIKLRGNRLHLPKIKEDIPLIVHRPLPKGAEIKRATVTMDTDGTFHVSICYEVTVSIDMSLREAALTGNASILETLKFLGLDYSQKHFYVDSNGEKANYPYYYRDAEEKLAREQRKLSRMEPGSNNYLRQKEKIAKLHRKIANQRLNFINELVHYLAVTYDVIVVEDIDLRTMGSCLSLGKSLHDNGFGMFRTKLNSKLDEKGSVLVKIDKWYPSTKTCSACGHVNDSIILDTTGWICPKCGVVHDRDENAAVNICREGRRIFLAYFRDVLNEKEKAEAKRKRKKKSRIEKRWAAA